MQRRVLLSVAATAALSGLGRAARAATANVAADGSSRRVSVRTDVVLADAPGAASLFLPVAWSADGWQVADQPLVLATNGRATLLRDARYEAPVMRIEWDANARDQSVTIVQTVATRDRAGPSGPTALGAADRSFWTAPTPSVPTDGIVRSTASRIVGNRTDPAAKLRAIYDWVVDNTWRDASVPGCGTGDIRAMLASGHFGGKCADINCLAVGLARACGLPARDVYGIRVAPSRFDAPLGRGGDISTAQHCRAEVFLDGAGWFPIDPADVRKVILEENLAPDHPRVAAARARLFGGWEMNWVAYNDATDIDLPGAGGRKPAFPFLMYPCAFTSAGEPNCVAPDLFRYRITATPT